MASQEEPLLTRMKNAIELVGLLNPSQARQGFLGVLVQLNTLADNAPEFSL